MAFCQHGNCANYIENGDDMMDTDDPIASSDLEPEDEGNEEEQAAAFHCPQILSCPEFEFSNNACYICNGYYGPCFGEPVCATCHAFLFPDDAGLLQTPLFSEKTDDEDSGNDEPVDTGDLFMTAVQRSCSADNNSSHGSTPIVSSPSDSPDQNPGPFNIQEINPRLVLRRINLGVDNNDAANHLDHNDDNPEGNNPMPLDGNDLQIQHMVENNMVQMNPHVENNSHEIFHIADEDIVIVKRSIPQLPERQNNYEEKGEPSRPWDLFQRLDLLTNYKDIEHKSMSDPSIVERLPPEVLLAVFSHLDDVSLWCAANVCQRWYNLLSTNVTSDLWQRHVKTRWPLFKPRNIKGIDWYKAYDRLASSAPCKTCLLQTSLHRSRPPRVEENSWRRNRLRMELKGLISDPPEGIAATPLDQMCCHWQATITGPVGSPYEGGLFYLYLQVPQSYPMIPPVVRFLTKILHPNVSRHGDVGIDSIHHNWSLALTIPKVLISVQSLLTDPYCQVCMEPELGEMYTNDRAKFDNIARAWTTKYAIEPSRSQNFVRNR